MDHGMFYPQVEYFAASYQVVTWDALLHGLSRPYRAFSLWHAADDLIQILDAEGIDRAHLVEVLQSYTSAEIAAFMDGVYKGIVPENPNQRIECPVLSLHGEKDNTGKVRVIPDASHNANQDQPAAFNWIVEQFLSTIPASSLGGTPPRQAPLNTFSHRSIAF
jgi:pimeloyl-ACP methyl ester carboxylesterase